MVEVEPKRILGWIIKVLESKMSYAPFLIQTLITSSTLENTVGATSFAKHLSQVSHKLRRSFPRGKMPPRLVFLLKDTIAHDARPSAGQHVDVAWEMADANLDTRLPLSDFVARDALTPWPAAAQFMIDPATGRGPGSAEPINADPGADLLIGPGIPVRPVMELLVDPAEQTYRAVGQAVAQGLGFGRLE